MIRGDLWQVCGYSNYFPNKTVCHDTTENILILALNTNNCEELSTISLLVSMVKQLYQFLLIVFMNKLNGFYLYQHYIELQGNLAWTNPNKQKSPKYLLNVPALFECQSLTKKKRWPPSTNEYACTCTKIANKMKWSFRDPVPENHHK